MPPGPHAQYVLGMRVPDLFVHISPISLGISLAGEDLFVHFSNIVGGNALVQDGQVEFGLPLTLTLTLTLALTLTLP